MSWATCVETLFQAVFLAFSVVKCHWAYEWGFYLFWKWTRMFWFHFGSAQWLKELVKHWCETVLRPTVHHAVHDHAAEVAVPQLPAAATPGLFHPVHSQQQIRYTLHGLWVVGNHQVQSLVESDDLILEILHIKAQRTAERNYTSSPPAGASSYLSHTKSKW